jgi:hypothetical protein
MMQMITRNLMVLAFLTCLSSALFAQSQPLPVWGTSPKKAATPNPTPTPRTGTPEPLELIVDDGRPLANIGKQLQDKYGVRISYEDIEWTYPSDLMPVALYPNVDRSRFKNPDMPVPTLASLRTRMEIDSVTKQPITPLDSVLRNANNDHQQRRNSGEFRILNLGEGRGFSIVPAKRKNNKGDLEETASPFDFRISFPSQERTSNENLNLIVSAITTVSGARLVIFDNLPAKRSVLVAKNEVARDVLIRLLGEFDLEISWRLLYDVDGKFWGLNLAAVYGETGVISRNGKPEIRPVYRRRPQ